MNPERWERVQTIFNDALDVDPEVRDARVSAWCEGDAELEEEVRSLLEADAADHGLLDEGIVGALGVAGPEVGAVVGAYRLLSAIGAGGMGEVYLAERADGQFEQKVALKLIRGASAGVRERFAVERQILARLQHPNIARLLDGGVTEVGRPYFTMDYVDGAPIDDHVRQQALPVERRLELMVRVCDAVHYAHQNLVVHRDLKPDNILVDADGEVKLLDFGIAKVLEAEEDVGLTTTGQRVMTPAWASPEQIRGEPVTTATDVHALGVILYHLLCGQSPWGEPEGIRELEAAVCERQPPPPSGLADSPRLRRRLSGDLDTICLKALRKEPERRYGSPQQLAEDLRRHLAGQPVSARRDTVGYRLGKFVRRHRGSVAAAAAVVALLGAVVATYTWRLSVERDRAQQEAAKARQVSAFLIDVFSAADPNESRGREITARTLLDRGSTRIDDEVEDPQVKAELMDVMGRVYTSVGRFEEAGGLLEGAVALRRQELGPDHPLLAASLAHLGDVRQEQSKLEEAWGLYEESLAIRRRQPEPEPVRVAESLLALGNVRWEQGRFEEAAPWFEEALAIQRRVLPPGDPAIAETLNQQGLLAYDRGDLDESERLYQKAFELFEARYGTRHPDTAATMNDLAHVIRHQGRLTEAEGLYRRALKERKALYGEEHPDVAHSLNHLARLLQAQGKFDEAVPIYREALAIRRGLYGDSHPAVGASMAGLAGTLMARGELEEAESLYRDALKLMETVTGGKHPHVAALQTSLGRCLHRRGKLEEAERMLRASLALHRELLPPEHINAAHPLTGLGRLLTDAGRAKDAEPLLRQALAIREANLPEGHARIAATRLALALCLFAQDQRDEAAPMAERALDARAEALGEEHPDVLRDRREVVEASAGGSSRQNR